ncbi:MAG: hypothetical protein Q8S21_04850 [Candidatus Paracaedibacteraceae bacterium]|nr:hypothetical protein [Candidatus Paracaedibacteraceae bacterium]
MNLKLAQLIVFLSVCIFFGTYKSNAENNATSKLTIQKKAKPKMLHNPLRKMAADIKEAIEEYKKERQFAQQRGVEGYYDELLNDANDLVKEIEAVSNEQNTKGRFFSKKDARSREETLRLLELMQHRTKPFSTLLWKINRMIADIKDEVMMPDQPLQQEMGFSVPLVPSTKKVQSREVAPLPKKQDEDEVVIKPIIKVKGTSAFPDEDELHKINR